MLLTINGTCNSTLDDLRIIKGSEVPIAGSLTFHQVGVIVCAGCTLIAVLLSLYLIWMHALHYTKPYEQRHIIRILFMVPVYAIASLLSFFFYWHAVYFEVLSSCYEAFAIASFFALLCHYLAPNVHEQKAYFRGITPKPWVLPINWFANCCGGQRGPWRTPASGLTWFNIIWTGIYQYCFIRVVMTIVAVVTQYFGKYCESSNSPVFAHIWVLVIEGAAVSIAMYCVIQFYIQLRVDLRPYSPFLKVLAIKLVIFLSFWQSFLISILTSSTLKIVEPTAKIAYPDLKVGIPSLLLCCEMAIFSILHLFAFPYQPYTKRGAIKYASASYGGDQIANEPGEKQGGFLGFKAFVDAINPWDLVKGFARGMRWLFVGVRKRKEDPSYKTNLDDMNLDPAGETDTGYKGSQGLPIANEYRRSTFGMPAQPVEPEEGANLLAHAQSTPSAPGSVSAGYVPARQRYDIHGQDISHSGTQYDQPYEGTSDQFVGYATAGPPAQQENIGMAVSDDPGPYAHHVPAASTQYLASKREARHQQRPSEQWANSSTPTQSHGTASDELFMGQGQPGYGQGHY